MILDLLASYEALFLVFLACVDVRELAGGSSLMLHLTVMCTISVFIPIKFVSDSHKAF